MLKSCKYCGRIHDTKFDCGMKPTRTKRTTNITRFRSSGAWQNKREIILELDNYLCAYCKQQGFYYSEDLEVHHIVSLADDFEKRLDEENLITLCEVHHEMADQGKIKKKHLRELVEDRYEGL